MAARERRVSTLSGDCREPDERNGRAKRHAKRTLRRPAPCLRVRVIRGIRADVASPPWLRERLRRIGINSISAVVDVTNYVAAELGQPMHAYDRALLRGEIRVRPAKSGERLTLLDDKEHGLDPEFLVIADDSGAIGLAGIMGGRSTAISSTTTDLFLEAAHFTPAAIAGRARRLGLFTDAAQRFERGVDPSLPPLAIERATALIVAIVGGTPGPVVTTRAESATDSGSVVASGRVCIAASQSSDPPAR